VKFVCRCEDITEQDVIEAIETYGCTTLAELKGVLRLGMGPCQGRTCLLLAAKLLARTTGKSLDEIVPSTRPPDVPIPVGMAAEDDDDG
jgi:bacterioferritin-associated ferredoxin